METAKAKQYIVVVLNNELYGINIKYIHNIIVMQGITRVPKAQSYFKGVINLRGEVIPVMSLRLRLGLEEESITDDTRILIVKPDEQSAPVGFIVDEVREVISLEKSNIDKISYDEQDVRTTFSTGIGKFDTDLINLLSVSGILADKESANN